MDTAGLDTAGASASTLAAVGTTQATGTQLLGPCLHARMGEEALVTALNAWGSARDREALALRADLTATQAGVQAAFEQAQAGVSTTLLNIIEAFRTEVEVMRQQTYYEAQQSLTRLEQVVSEARAARPRARRRPTIGRQAWRRRSRTSTSPLRLASAAAAGAVAWQEPPLPPGTCASTRATGATTASSTW